MLGLTPRHRFIFVLNILFIALLVAGASWYIATERTAYISTLDANIHDARVTLQELALLTSRNEAPPAIDAVVTDCQARGKFESYLNQLGTLSSEELGVASQYFDACADYFAVKKNVVVLVLAREYEAFADLIRLRQDIDTQPEYEHLLRIWGDIVELEEVRAKQLNRQVTLQREILTTLRGDRSAASVEETMAAAGGTTATLGEATARIDALLQEEKAITILP